MEKLLNYYNKNWLLPSTGAYYTTHWHFQKMIQHDIIIKWLHSNKKVLQNKEKCSIICVKKRVVIMENLELANLMFPNVKETIQDYEKKYPERDLPKGVIVSRYAPSPTGFVHMGNMLSCFIESKLPKQSTTKKNQVKSLQKASKNM